MNDPLSLLRQATVAGKPIVSTNGNYAFGAIQLPEQTSTCFRRSLKGNDYCYTLKDIVVFLASADLGEVEYRKKVVQEGAGVTFVVGHDRQALKSYITGAIDSCPQIDLQLASSYQLPAQSVSSASADMHTMSVEKMQEQRERYAAQMEKTILKAKSAGGEAQDALSTLKQLKRKSAQAFDGDGEDEVIDRQFLEADRSILESLRADELPAHTRSTVMNAHSTDFAIVLKLFSEKVLKPMQVPSKAPSPHAPAGATATSARRPGHPSAGDASKPSAPAPAAAQSGPRGEGVTQASGGPAVRNYPIIVVPSALTSCITLINAEDFLINGAYHTVEEKRKAGAQKTRELYLPRALPNGGHIVYRVIEDPTKLKEGEWEHVVAVFASGQAWQFKGWKYSSPVTLFQNVLGVHVCVDSAVVDLNVQSWNCKVLKVNLFKQHINAGAAREFWMYLDDYTKLHRARSSASRGVVAAPSHAPGHAHATASHGGSSGARPAGAPPVSSSRPAHAGAGAAAPVRSAVPPPPPPQYRAPPPPAPPAMN